MNQHGDDRADPEHDAWLRAALRHAPDAELGAPPAVSAAILREAGAVRPTAARRSAWQPLWEAWSWLARPPVAAGFASVMVAGVVGLMWWDRPLEEALPRMSDMRAAAPVGAAPASASDAASTVASPPAIVAEAAPARAAARAAAKSQPALPAVASRSETRARATAATAPAQTAKIDNADTERSAAAPVAEPEMARDVAAPAALADARPPSPAMKAARRAESAAPPVAAAGPAGASGAALLARAAPSPSPLPSAFATLRAEVHSQAQRWTWQLGTGTGTGTVQAMTPALQAWLTRASEAAAGAAQPQAEAAGNATVLRLLRDGRLHSTVTLGERSLGLVTAGAPGAPSASALNAETAEALKAALDDAVR